MSRRPSSAHMPSPRATCCLGGTARPAEAGAVAGERASGGGWGREGVASSASEAGDDGSTPPGWLAGLARAPNGVVAGGIEVEALTSPGAFALVHCASAGPGPATAQEEESLGRATVAALTAAGLGSGDVLLARHYAPGGGWGGGRGVGVGRGLRAGAAVTVPVVGCGLRPGHVSGGVLVTLALRRGVESQGMRGREVPGEGRAWGDE